MTDTQVARPKRKGNYVPERIKAIEKEIAEKYAGGQSALALAREYGISKAGVQGAARRQGVPIRGKAEAGKLYRTVDCNLTPEEMADERPIAQQVAERMGYASTAGLSYDREFQTACTREYRRRHYEQYREYDSRRKKFLNKIPKWQSRREIDEFLSRAHAMGMEVDHIIPLQGETICGLNVMSNLRLISPARNQAKQNRLLWSSDPLIGPLSSSSAVR